MSHKEPKHPLSIRLTEPVVFLRGSPDALASRRRREGGGDSTPAMLRGLFTLHLTKPTRISSIELELEGKSTVSWPDGVGHRRVDIPEENKILSARSVFFSAKACADPPRSMSLGPGSRCVYEDDDELSDESRPGSSRSARRIQSRTSLDSIADMPMGPNPSHVRRRNSADLYGWQQGAAGPDTAATLDAHYPPTHPVSPPYTPEPVYSSLFAETSVSRPQTPTDARSEGFQLQHNRFKSEDNPGQMLEEYRNALRMGIGSSIHPALSRIPSGPSPDSSEVALAGADFSPSRSRSLFDVTSRGDFSKSAPASRSASRDVDYREAHFRSPASHNHPVSRTRTASPSTPLIRSPRSTLPPFDLEHESRPRGRHSSRWSLSNMSSVFKDVKDKMRNNSPKDVERHRGRSREPNVTALHMDPVVLEEREMHRHDRERKSALGKLTAVPGLEEAASMHGWKEFRKGTYTYPISFSIPANTPPTLHCDYGSVAYRLKAVVHRPGALTTKLSISTEVTLVACPADDGTEDIHSIIVERQWDAQLRYLIALNGRSFPIGSMMSFHLTMVPLEKCKVYRLSVFLEEKTEYFGNSKKLKREQPLKRFELLSIRHKEKTLPPPILPLDPENGDLLKPYVDTSDTSTPDEALSSLMGPGPWSISHELQIPAQCDRLRFTYRHKGAHIAVHHILKVVFRVERGDDACLDPKTGKRRLFDIVVQTPIHILSCHCNPEHTTLPRYSLFATGTGAGNSAPLRSCACSHMSTTIPVTHNSPVPTPANSRPGTADANSSGHSNGYIESDAERVSSGYQFARLISGQESVRGEAPPEYTEVVR